MWSTTASPWMPHWPGGGRASWSCGERGGGRRPTWRSGSASAAEGPPCSRPPRGRAGPTRSGSTWRRSATPCWATPDTAAGETRPGASAWLARSCMHGGFPSSTPDRGTNWWWRSPSPTTSRRPSAGSGRRDPACELPLGGHAEHGQVLLVVLERVARDRVDEDAVVELRTVGPAERFVREALQGRHDVGE